jgi:peroxiredoxin
LDDWQGKKAELAATGAAVAVAASVDSAWNAQEIADSVDFPVAQGASRAQGEAVGAWWEEARGFIQPAEFIVDRSGKVLASSYSAGPIGRVDAADAVKLISFWEARKKK